MEKYGKLELTSEKVKKFYQIMQDHYHIKIKQKDDAWYMKGIGYFLEVFGDITEKDFMENFTTTLGEWVFLNFEIGNEKQKKLVNQVSLLIHELVHVKDYREEAIIMPILYLSQNGEKSIYEARAWSANIEFRYRANGSYKPNFDSFGEKFRKYGGNSDDKKVIAKALESDFLMIEQGIKISPIVRHAIEVLKELGCWK